MTFSFSNKDKYSLKVIEKNKVLVDDIQNHFLSKFKSDHNNKKLTLSCIKKIYGVNVVFVDKEFFNNDHYLITEYKELSKEVRKIIILFAIEGICDERIDKVEDRL